ncbi:putative reverse transcriptase domain-containing protein [Tanacetum coccineum]
MKSTAGFNMGTGFNVVELHIRTQSREVIVVIMEMTFKFMNDTKFCPSHECKRWNPSEESRPGSGCHAAYTDRFHELARLVPHLVTPESRMIERYVYGLAPQIREMVAATEPKTMQKAVQISGALTDEAVRNGSIKKVEKRGNVGEPSKDRSRRDDNKRTRTGNVFATTVNPVGRENTGTWPKCTTCNSYHVPGGPCRTCFNCNRPGHLARDYRGVPRNVNPVNARNPTVRACYECGSRGSLPRSKHCDGGQLVEIDKVIKGCKLEIEGHVFDIDLIPFGHGSFDVIIGSETCDEGSEMCFEGSETCLKGAKCVLEGSEICIIKRNMQVKSHFERNMSKFLQAKHVGRFQAKCARKCQAKYFKRNMQFPAVKGWLDEDLDNYHLKELRCSTQCHTQMSMWIISRGVVLLILLMEYKVLRDFLLHRSSINNSARLSNKFGGFYFSFKFDISGLLHHVITTIAYRIRDKDTSQSKQNLQSSSMTFIHKTLIIPSVLDSCFISSTVSEVKRYSAYVRRIVADFSHAPPNEYSPSPDDKKQWSLGCWFGGKLIQKLRQKGVYEESFSRHAAWIGGKLIQFMHTTMVPVQWGRGVKEKNMNASNIEVVKDGAVPSVTVDSRNVAKEVVSPSVVDETVSKDKQSSLVDTTLGSYLPLPTQGTTTASNTPGKSSYANVTGKPSGTKVNFRTLFTPEGLGLMWLSRWNLLELEVNDLLTLHMVSSWGCRWPILFSMDSLDAMLENGRWFIRNNPLILRKWHPDVNLMKEDVGTILVWVKLHGVPVTAFNEDA